MRNQIDMSPLPVSLLEQVPEQLRQIFGPILLQRILTSQNLPTTKIGDGQNTDPQSMDHPTDYTKMDHPQKYSKLVLFNVLSC